MSGNSGTGGRFARKQINRERYEQALTEFRDVLDSADVVGWPKRDAELHELRRLVATDPAEARQYLAEVDPPENARGAHHGNSSSQ